MKPNLDAIQAGQIKKLVIVFRLYLRSTKGALAKYYAFDRQSKALIAKGWSKPKVRQQVKKMGYEWPKE